MDLYNICVVLVVVFLGILWIVPMSSFLVWYCVTTKIAKNSSRGVIISRVISKNVEEQKQFVIIEYRYDGKLLEMIVQKHCNIEESLLEKICIGDRERKFNEITQEKPIKSIRSQLRLGRKKKLELISLCLDKE